MPDCAYINRILNMHRVLNMPKFRIRQSSEYGRVLNMRTLNIVLNMPEYVLTEFWMYVFGFLIHQESEYARVT